RILDLENEKRDIQEQQDVNGMEVLSAQPGHGFANAGPWLKNSTDRDVFQTFKTERLPVTQVMLGCYTSCELQDIACDRVGRVVWTGVGPARRNVVSDVYDSFAAIDP